VKPASIALKVPVVGAWPTINDSVVGVTLSGPGVGVAGTGVPGDVLVDVAVAVGVGVGVGEVPPGPDPIVAPCWQALRPASAIAPTPSVRYAREVNRPKSEDRRTSSG
jgi:hypothetical protein